jgi:hypothetical protein
MEKAGTVVAVAEGTVVVVVTGFVAVVIAWVRGADVAGDVPQPLTTASPPTARTMTTDR